MVAGRLKQQNILEMLPLSLPPFFFQTTQQTEPANFDNDFLAGKIQMCIKWNCILVHQFKLKMKEQFLKSVIEICGVVTYFLFHRLWHGA